MQEYTIHPLVVGINETIKFIWDHKNDSEFKVEIMPSELVEKPKPVTKRETIGITSARYEPDTKIAGTGKVYIFSGSPTNWQKALEKNIGSDRPFLFLSFGTDGVDGPTDAAGAIVDGSTICRSKKLGLDAKKFLMNNDSYTLFSKLKDLIYTGATSTNVNDLSIVVIN